MKIAIFGSGGVGGYFGGRLAAAGEDVTFLARGAHLTAMQQDGLHIDSPNGALHLPKVQATDRPQAIGPVDVVLFTVKLYDVETAAATLAYAGTPTPHSITKQSCTITIATRGRDLPTTISDEVAELARTRSHVRNACSEKNANVTSDTTKNAFITA